jgi:hypothetical protein
MNNGVALMYAVNQRVSADGRKRVDLVDRYGRTIRNAYVMSGVGMPLNVPLEQETPPTDYTKYPQVVVGFMQGDPLPVVLGALDNSSVSYTSETSTDTYYDTDATGGPELKPAADADIEANTASMEEVVLAAPQGGRLILKRNGHAMLAGVGVSMQVPEGSYVRVSAGGDTSGRVALAKPLTDLLNDMTFKINDLQQEVADLRAQLMGPTSLNLLNVGVAPVQTSPPSPVPVQALVLLPAAVLPLQGQLTDVGLSAGDTLPGVDVLTISSATLRISSVTEG